MDIHKIIGQLPRPKKGFVLPDHKYTGPYNPLEKQLDENDIPLLGQEPFNNVDAISMRHDICYRDKDKTGKQKCDDRMLIELDELDPKDIREKIDKTLVRKLISTKKRVGWGIKWTNELADELHKPIKRKFQKRFVFVRNVDDTWAVDLIEMRPFSRVNKGMKYILMVIDIFSKFGWAVPLKSKTGIVVAEAFKKLFKTHTPSKIWADDGREFYNKDVKALLLKHNIHLYSTYNKEKSTVVERWNRTIKTRMWKYFTANGTYKYIDILDKLIDQYNNTRHRSIGCTPTDARKPASYQQVFKNLYYNKVKNFKEPKFQVGDKVRISKEKKTFEKGYTQNWTDQIYTITEIKKTIPPTYKIKDQKGEVIGGTFYEPELQKTKQELHRVEKVLRWRVRNGVREGRVKWVGYDSSHNSWERNIQKL